jgi:hypothetical protein
MKAIVSALDTDFVVHFRHRHLGEATVPHPGRAPPNSDNSVCSGGSNSRSSIASSTAGNSDTQTTHATVKANHRRSSSCFEVKPATKSPIALCSTVCSSKGSPVKAGNRRKNRSFSLDLSSVVDRVDTDHKAKEINRIQLQTRLYKGEIRRIYWDDLRREKQEAEDAYKEAELSEMVTKSQLRQEFERAQAQAKREEELRRRNWLSEKAKENQSVKKSLQQAEKLKLKDEISRTMQSSISMSQAKADLKQKQQQQAEEQRKSYYEFMLLQKKARADKAHMDMKELMEGARRQVDELFETVVKENREVLGKLMTAKYSRKH